MTDTVDIADALVRGLRRTVARSGLAIVGLVYLLGVVSGLFGPARPADGPSAPPGFPGDTGTVAFPDPVVAVPSVVAAFVGFLSSLALLVVAIGAVRTFLTDERDALPPNAFTRRLGPAFLNAFLGFVLFAIVTAVGFALLVVPGILLVATLGFWIVFVVDADESFVDGFRRSWELTRGHRLRLSVLVLLVLVVTVPINLFFSVVGIGLGNLSPLLGVLVGQSGRAFVTVFVWATLAATYRQLAEEDDATPDVVDDDAGDDGEWKFDP
ncbi:MAG: hypothetical protein ABEJ34_08790 [Haloferacaceae archaeon]